MVNNQKHLDLYLCTFCRYVLFAVVVTILGSCSRNEDRSSSTYDIVRDDAGRISMELLTWHVIGPFTQEQDSMLTDSIIADPLCFYDYERTDTTVSYWYNDVYQPKWGQMDLKEVFNIEPSDTIRQLDSLFTYLSCELKAKENMDIYLEVKRSMACDMFMNSDTLERIDIQGLNLYKAHLKQGINNFVVKTMGVGDDYTLETVVYDSISAAHLYAEGQSGNIVYTEILNNIIMITNAHQRITADPVKLQFHDVYGNLVNETVLKKDTFVYDIPELKNNVSYICSMIICGDTVRQAVLNGYIDDVCERLEAIRDSLPKDCPRLMEINEVFYRLNFLLNHPTRHDGDWWWQFKIGALTYQLEHIYAHLDDTYGQDKNEYNVQFVTYKSKLDGGPQRYVIVTPNKIKADREYPLVVIVRPNIVNHYHLFACPQIARQWAVNIMQSLANQYDYIVMMPEARMIIDEELIPFADSEMLLAIDDVKKHFRIDEDRVYLHANCSGGYRALQLAENHPDMFAAIGLYAPVYDRELQNQWSKEHSPMNNIENLCNMPMFIHGDPLDTHSPYSMYSKLVDDCREHDIPLTLSMKRNSGQAYNIVVAGKEAFDFFKDKTKKGRETADVETVENKPVVADLYSKPFVYVYNSSDTTMAYNALVDSIRTEYEDYFFSKLPLVPDTKVTKKMMSEKNVFLIGNRFSNTLLKSMSGKVNSKEDILIMHNNSCGSQHVLMQYASNNVYQRLSPWNKCIHQCKIDSK